MPLVLLTLHWWGALPYSRTPRNRMSTLWRVRHPVGAVTGQSLQQARELSVVSKRMTTSAELSRCAGGVVDRETWMLIDSRIVT